MLNIENSGLRNYINYNFNDEPQEHLYSNNLLFKATHGNRGTGGVSNLLIKPTIDTRADTQVKIPQQFKINVYNSTSNFNRGKNQTKAHCEFMSVGIWILLGIVAALAMIVTAGGAWSICRFMTAPAHTVLVSATAGQNAIYVLLPATTAVNTALVAGVASKCYYCY